MKKFISILMTTAMLFSASAAVCNADSDFSDISGHWAEETIAKWQDKGIITGYPDGTFKPDNPVTRAELSKIFTTAFDLTEKISLEEYCDLDTEAWYYPYVECAAKYLPMYPLMVTWETNLPYIDNDNSKDKGFLPEVDAIRMHTAEALVEIKKAKENLNVDVPVIQDVAISLRQTFKDGDYESLYPMHGQVPTNISRMFNYTWLSDKLDIMKGDTDSYFRPYDKITRAEVLTVIDRMLAE